MSTDAPTAGPGPLDRAPGARRRLRLDDEVLSFRASATLPPLLFAPTLIGALVSPGSWWGTTLGILFHISALFFISRIPAPAWARAAAFGWLTVDIAVGIMTLNLVPYDIYMPMRLGGHVMAAMWLITVSVLSRPLIIQILGVIAGLWLGLFSFFGALLPVVVVGPPGVLVVVWILIVGLRYQPDPLGGVTQKFSRKTERFAHSA